MNIQVRWNNGFQCFECVSDDGLSLAVQSHDVEHLLGRNFERDVETAFRSIGRTVAPLTDTDFTMVADYARSRLSQQIGA